MSRKTRGRDIHGWVILDKPEGLSSSQAVGKVRWLLDARKAGHGGTLDPLASGILPIGLGEATKAMPFIVDASKDYAFTIRWGEARDTDDREGAVIATSDVRPSDEAINKAAPAFIGEIEQAPPVYSAIKVDGRRAYALARAGEAPVLAARPVRIDALSLLGSSVDGAESRFRMTCGKGTYVRSLARDLAASLGALGYISKLRRTRVGPFSLADAISLEKLEALVHGAPAQDIVHSVATALDDIPALAVTETEADRIIQGQRLRFPTARDGRVCVLSGDRLVAIADVTDGTLHPARVFNL